MKQNIWEGISGAAGKGLMKCHIDRGNCSQIGYNHNLSAKQIIYYESYNKQTNEADMFNRMYVGTYSKAACFHALNKYIQFNDVVISLHGFWSGLPDYCKVYDKSILSDKDSVIVNIFDETYYC